MLKQRNIVAWWLLLLLARVLTPEATLLRLHAHQHTTKEVAIPLLGQAAKKHMLTDQHLHCHTEQLYNAPFQPAEAVLLPELLQQALYAQYQAPVSEAPTLHLLDGASLRGPPSRA
ncbi:hypothetical protein [Hymenobacter wooponensis]|uniref:Uncharacterized protein n=1 Tax=Hymenobacter wooponensis TaxID=1525360 RepID=A0A4Z0MLS5_9BACT|nr:hypothetical protein [Hymenobacter wooponensis]TGD80436.1 hypothetical protein EU557_11390 [Hymenobacter wooponensis]